MGKDLSLAVVIPTFRRGKYLVNTITFLLNQTSPADEIIVVDQTPVNEHSEDVISFLSSGNSKGLFQWIQLSEPSVSKARNHAALVSKSEILLYVDDDIEIDDHFIELHLRNYSNSEVQAVVGPVLTKDNLELITPPHNFLERPVIEQAFTYSDRFSQRMEHVGFMWAGNFSVKKSALVKIGGWDEHIINYGDRDLGIRLATNGFRIDYDPQPFIVHLNAPIGGTRVIDPKSPFKGWQRCVSIQYLAFRHLKGMFFIKYGLYRSARFSFLLKQNALRPWVWPFEIYSYIKALTIARNWSKAGVNSPFMIKK